MNPRIFDILREIRWQRYLLSYEIISPEMIDVSCLGIVKFNTYKNRNKRVYKVLDTSHTLRKGTTTDYLKSPRVYFEILDDVPSLLVWRGGKFYRLSIDREPPLTEKIPSGMWVSGAALSGIAEVLSEFRELNPETLLDVIDFLRL